MSRPRGPAYTIRPQTKIHIPSFGPGPQYNVSKLTNYGTDSPPAYTIASRKPFKGSQNNVVWAEWFNIF